MITALFAGRARAQPVPPLSVSRAAGADDCPDAEGLLARIAQIRKSAPRADQPSYRVAFARDDTGLRAEITDEQTAGTRVLSDRSPECAALAQATAVTLALLFDADAQAIENAPPPAPQAEPTAQPPPTNVEPVESEADERDSLRLSLALGGGALVGVTRPIAPALDTELSVHNARYRAVLGALFVPALAFDFESGTVHTRLLAGSLHACVAPWSQGAWRFDVCAGAWLGALHASARGFDTTDATTRLWSALALDLRIARLPAPFGAELGASLLVPLRRQDFEIVNLGPVYESLPVAGLISLRAAAGW